MSRTFTLVRNTDVSGVSGTGNVAFGVEFPDGQVVMRWNTSTATTSIFANIGDVETIHGHEGSSVIVWDDQPDTLGMGKSITIIGAGQPFDGHTGTVIQVDKEHAFAGREFLVKFDTPVIEQDIPLWFAEKELSLNGS